MSACLLRSVIRDFISSDKRIRRKKGEKERGEKRKGEEEKEKRNKAGKYLAAVAGRPLQRKVTLGIHDGRSSFPRRFRSS